MGNRNSSSSPPPLLPQHNSYPSGIYTGPLSIAHWGGWPNGRAHPDRRAWVRPSYRRRPRDMRDQSFNAGSSAQQANPLQPGHVPNQTPQGHTPGQMPAMQGMMPGQTAGGNGGGVQVGMHPQMGQHGGMPPQMASPQLQSAYPRP
ncbi:hypothetical protein LTR95_017153 [Oleoguttula sp. CCFEE 5521]